MAVSVLCVDDDPTMRETLGHVLHREGYAVTSVGTGEEALEALAASPIDVVLLDMHLPGISGREVLDRAVRRDGPLFVMITGDTEVRTAVACMRAGAYDYVLKPPDFDALLLILHRAAEHIRTREQVALLRSGSGERFGEMIGSSPVMRRVFDLVQRAAATSDTTVLITGESGTGKELVARAIHRESDRAAKAFVAVNCTAVQETLLESEFFGHERGAFTDARDAKKGLLEVADGGSIFLDEIGDMTEKLQAKLLRFLEDHSFRRLGGTQTLRSDVRIIAATNKDLDGAVESGAFRPDLYYRLKVLPIELPPLRERRSDIPLLATYFLEEYSAQRGGAPKHFTPAALEALTAYGWPGNVRELRNIIERVVILEDAESLGPEHLPPEIAPDRAAGADVSLEPISAMPYTEAKKTFIERFTRQYVSTILDEHDGNVTRSARQARMDRANFQRLMRKVGLSARDFTETE